MKFLKKVWPKKMEEAQVQFADEDGSRSDDYDSAEERMAISSSNEEDVPYLEFNEATHMEDPKFSLGMSFSSSQIFREVVRKYAIKHHRSINLKKILGKKINWICVERLPSKCYGIQQQRRTSFQIKTLNQQTYNPTWI